MSSTDRQTTIALVAILALSLGVRLWGIDFGLPLVMARPDELAVLHAAVRMHGGDPNPHFFDYPAVYMYVLAGVYSVFYGVQLLRGRVADPAAFVTSFRDSFEPFFLIARTTTAVLGTLTVALCYRIAAAFFDRTAALASAFFLALAFLHVRDSHYGTTDVPMTFFVIAAMFGLVRLHQTRARADAWLAGALAGLAVGTKYNAVLLAAPLLVVEMVHARANLRDVRRLLRETHLVRWGIACAACFLATNPYLVLDVGTAARDLRLLQDSTALGMTPRDLLGRGWWYHLPFSLRHGVGAPLLAASLAGYGWMLYRAPVPALILGAFPISYYVAVGAAYNVFVRYMMPVVPFLCIFAGYGVAQLVSVLRPGRARPLAAAALSLGLVLPSAASVVRFNTIISAEDTRLAAGRWMREYAPAGSTIFMAGTYGHLQLERAPSPPKYRYMRYDRGANRFVLDGRPAERLPDWIVVQRSPLPYSVLPPALERLVASEYVLAHAVRAGNLFQDGNVYDMQDAFYVPYGGFKGVRRAGPNLEIYRRRPASVEALR